ncbi:choice-of-anchor Q domain-containing protein [Dokdonella sp.]|uniref:choice-of-anchor Q domain-containing protein n=1 Tax=Dokdonella sp. TaxID=2291710 RepID=UPI0031BCDD6F|nr:hypothetical protein [Dokdonella sp.]
MSKQPDPIRLTVALLAGLVAGTTQAAVSAPDLAPAVPPGLRADPARRIFADLSAPRRPPTPPGRHATHLVGNCDDDGIGSLRGTIAGAGDGDVIDLTRLTCARITLATGAIAVDADNLTLAGPGRDQLTIDGHRDDRVFVHSGQGTFTLRGLTVENGLNRADRFDVAGGACIASAAFITLVDASVRNCYAAAIGAYGGALYAYGLTMANSTLSGNTALGVHGLTDTAAFGGAAFVYTMDLTDSTVSGNQAIHRERPGYTSYDIGGGIVSVRGGEVRNSTIDANRSGGRGGGIATFSSMTVVNSTFSGNLAASAMGGALFLRWPAALRASNSTLTGNVAVAGGGLWLTENGTQLQSTLIQGNFAGAGHFADIEGPAGRTLSIQGGNNLIGANAPELSLPGDTLHADAGLGPLLANGGPTRTHALAPGSPAIDAGNNREGLADDQRGSPFVRVFGAAADIGAYEWQPGAPPEPATPVPTLGAAGRGIMWALMLLFASLGLRRHGSRRG